MRPDHPIFNIINTIDTTINIGPEIPKEQNYIKLKIQKQSTV